MSTHSAPRLSRGRIAAAALLYALFVVYGSLIPFDWRARATADALAAFEAIPYLELGVASRADWVANILLYIPLSFLGTAALAIGRRPWVAAIGASVVATGCVTLAFAIEFAQLYFPPRTVSQNDLIAETIGTALGIVLWFGAGPRLFTLWRGLLAGGHVAHRSLLVLFVLGYLALSFFPYDLLVSAAELRQKLANPANVTWGLAGSCDGALSCSAKLAAELLIAMPIGALLAWAVPAMRVPAALFVGLVIGLVIEGGQLLLASGVSQGVSLLTRALGVAWGLALQHTLRFELIERHARALRTAVLAATPLYLAALAVLNGFSGRLEPAWTAAEKLRATRFTPFYYHYFTSETAAMWSLLANAAAYAPVGIGLWLLRPRAARAGLAAATAATIALAIEALKLFVAGAKPDPTNLLIAAASAALVHAALARLAARGAVPRSASGAAPTALQTPATASVARSTRGSRQRQRHTRRLAWAGAATTAALVGIGALLATPYAEKPADEASLPQLPPGEALPAVLLPNFRFQHPRLPHPSAGDIERLQREGSAYLGEMRRLAAAASPDGYSYQARAVLELIEPGSQDLAGLHTQLMSTQFEWRGHDQVRPLVVAYDWLYERWTPMQRELLRGKLAEGCEYLVNFIRSERLSPYNVYLYNAPFQALVACSLALWGDDPRGEPVMRFTADLWQNRVLPVWRQVMGRHGGWHEGGEYVGIGIGGAIWEVPAMWRSATGEDLLKSEPGIRGFLDFLIHRTRPDGTQLRIGDGSYFDRAVPARIPLAIEYLDAAAYTMGPPNAVAPTAWPWGPLPRPWLLDPQALARKPLARLFDGIGWVIARSSWTPDATMVSFKAGDNYWSHSHLDQGSFTIYKGGALALDSGANYGPGYGSDHHLNYSYQTIAHNTITVTDPADTVPLPAKPQEPTRQIANDGGQRRVGSGWGIEPAPLDLDEWLAKRELYHTGRIERFEDKDGITLAAADITPAYTNALSGRGTFSHRTRRVERAWRVFAFDRVDDVVVVYDDVLATQPHLRKRWLLHTTNQPQIDGRSFVAEVAPRQGPGRGGGRLEGRVLLPRAATLLPVGGRGFEFFVADTNYDEGGKLVPSLDKLAPDRVEPGRWRLELIPANEQAADRFLVVLLPRRLGEQAPHRVSLIEQEGRVAAEVSGPTRTVRYWFREGVLGAQIEIVAR